MLDVFCHLLLCCVFFGVCDSWSWHPAAQRATASANGRDVCGDPETLQQQRRTSVWKIMRHKYIVRLKGRRTIFILDQVTDSLKLMNSIYMIFILLKQMKVVFSLLKMFLLLVKWSQVCVHWTCEIYVVSHRQVQKTLFLIEHSTNAHISLRLLLSDKSPGSWNMIPFSLCRFKQRPLTCTNTVYYWINEGKPVVNKYNISRRPLK